MEGPSLIMTAVYKSVLFHRVPVEVAEEQHFAFSVAVEDVFLEVIDFGVVALGGVLPFAVEVVPRYARSVVAVDDAVGVQHRNDFKHEVLPQLASLLVVGGEELQDAVDHVRADGFAGMHPPADEDVSLVEGIVGMVLSNCDKIDTVACQRLAQVLSLEVVAHVGVQLELLQEGVQVRISEGVAVREEHFVMVVLKRIGPGEREVTLEHRRALTVAILVVLDVLAAAVPAKVVVTRLPTGIRDDAHA